MQATDDGIALWYAAVNELGAEEAGVVSVLTASEQRQLNSLLRKLLAGFGDGDNWDEDKA